MVCIHCNASSSSQWRPLMDRLAQSHHVLAPDNHGAGRGPPWPSDHALTLLDEVALLEPAFARAGKPFALIGHSYDAAVALLAALQQPERVRALVLYEPNRPHIKYRNSQTVKRSNSRRWAELDPI